MYKNAEQCRKIPHMGDKASREAWFPGGPRSPKNPIFLKIGKNHPKLKNSKTSRQNQQKKTFFARRF